jgi:hypothetical protein
MSETKAETVRFWEAMKARSEGCEIQEEGSDFWIGADESFNFGSPEQKSRWFIKLKPKQIFQNVYPRHLKSSCMHTYPSREEADRGAAINDRVGIRVYIENEYIDLTTEE